MNIPQNVCNYLNQYFDKIFVISLPRFKERHENVIERLEGLQYQFFFGADMDHMNIEALKKDKIYDEAASFKIQRFNKPLNLRNIACSLSHRYLYEEIVKFKYKKVLILEDDAVPIYSNLVQLVKAMSQLPDNWELVYFGYTGNEVITPSLKRKQRFYNFISILKMMKWDYGMVKNLLPKTYSQHLKKAGYHNCTHAYAITLEAAEKMVKAHTPIILRADEFISVEILKENINGFVTEPQFFIQADFVGTIFGADEK